MLDVCLDSLAKLLAPKLLHRDVMVSERLAFASKPWETSLESDFLLKK